MCLIAADWQVFVVNPAPGAQVFVSLLAGSVFTPPLQSCMNPTELWAREGALCKCFLSYSQFQTLRSEAQMICKRSEMCLYLRYMFVFLGCYRQ